MLNSTRTYRGHYSGNSFARGFMHLARGL